MIMNFDVCGILVRLRAPWLFQLLQREQMPMVLNIDFGQEAAKMSEVKVGEGKKFLPMRPIPRTWVRTRPLGRYFFDLKL